MDGRADIYALGAVLYEALAGHPPFEAATVYALIHQVQTQALTPPSAGAAGIPAALEAIVLRALAKHPEERFGTAHEMAAVLAPLAVSPRAPASRTPRQGPERTLLSVPTVWAEGTTQQEVVAGAVRQWPASPLGRRPIAPLLNQLADRPLHAPAFSGALELPGAILLFCDGVLYEAFSPETGAVGDAVVGGLAVEVDATLRPVAPGVEPRSVALFASLLREPEALESWLDAAVTDLPRLSLKLAEQQFDGALRLTRGPALGFALYSKGARVLDLFGEGWPAARGGARWDQWIGASGARARVEPRRATFPSLSFRQQLAECPLDVVRPAADAKASLRSDAAAEAQALRLAPRGASPHRSGSMLDALVEGDPAQGSARWLLAELPLQFDQFGRSARWRKLVEALPRVTEVRLHHAPTRDRGRPFDAATFDGDGRLRHLLDRVAMGCRSAVDAFVERVIVAKEGGARDLGGALLFAPRFDEEALDAYLGALRSRGSLLGALSHREGFVRTSASDGFHLLLVEEGDGKRRPLVPE